MVIVTTLERRNGCAHRSSQPQELKELYSTKARIRYPARTRASSKYPPAKPGALSCEPLKAAIRGR